MSCRLMLVIDNDFSHLKYDQKERIKSIVCGGLCGGNCRDEYIIKKESFNIYNKVRSDLEQWADWKKDAYNKEFISTHSKEL